MSISEATSTLKRVLEDCAYDFGSTSYQDSCQGISVSNDGSTIYVRISMRVLEPYYKSEVDENIRSTIQSIINQYDIPYRVNYNISYTYKYA